MRLYNKVAPAFWTDPRTAGLSDRGRLFALYLLTGPHSNSIGCFRLPAGYIAEDLGWDGETVRQAVAETVASGFVERDDATGWTFIPRRLRHDPPANANVGKSMMPLIEAVPRALPFYQRFVAALSAYRERFPERYLDRFREPLMRTAKTPEPEPVPEPVPDPALSHAADASSSDARASDASTSNAASCGASSSDASSSDASSCDAGARTAAPRSRTAIAAAFERFWAAYPSRGAQTNPRKPAAEKFARLVRGGTDAALLVRAAGHYAAAMQASGRAGSQFVKQAVSWLNAGLWEQYAEPPAPPPPDNSIHRNGQGRRRHAGTVDDDRRAILAGLDLGAGDDDGGYQPGPAGPGDPADGRRLGGAPGRPTGSGGPA